MDKQRGGRRMRYVVTITDNIGQSNMPFHEFACYRHSHFTDEHQVVFVMGNEHNDSQIPTGLDVRHVGTSLSKIRKEIDNVLLEAKSADATLVFHVHEAKSVIRLFLCMGLKLRKRTIYTVHSTFSGYHLKNKIMAYVAAFLTNRVTCVSETSYEHFPRSIKNIKKEKVVAVQNGVDIERINKVSVESDDAQNSSTLLTLIYTARLIPLKAHDRLLKILTELPEYRLILLGGGPLREHLKNLCRDYNIESRVFFYGIRPRDEVFSVLKKADAYVSTSTLEGLPISLLEAMACALPSFASNIEQHQEVKKACPSLFCFSSDEELVNELREFAGLSKNDRLSISERARSEVIESFSLKRMHDNYSRIYEAVEG